MNSPQTCVMRRSILPAVVFLCLTNQAAHAGSASWNLNPGSALWDTASNWTPATEPNGPGEIATFAVSNVTNLQMASRVEVDSIVFNPGASAFTFTPDASAIMPLILSGAGIQNKSNAIQSFVAPVQFLNEGLISFTGSASAGTLTAFTAEGAEEMSAFGGLIQFHDNASADRGNFLAAAGLASGAHGGSIEFDGFATADGGTFTNDAGQTAGALGGGTGFSGSASAGMAQLNAVGSPISGGIGGQITFREISTASDARLTALSGMDGGAGGAIVFDDDASGGDAKVVVAGNAQMDISAHNGPGETVGSVEGDGTIFLGANKLTISGTAAAPFSGVISDGGANGGQRGSLTKTGFGNLTLSGTNTYSGSHDGGEQNLSQRHQCSRFGHRAWASDGDNRQARRHRDDHRSGDNRDMQFQRHPRSALARAFCGVRHLDHSPHADL